MCQEGRHHDQDVGQKKVGAAGRQDIVDDQSCDLGENKAGKGAQNGRKEGCSTQERVGAGIDPDTAKGFHEKKSEDGRRFCL